MLYKCFDITRVYRGTILKMQDLPEIKEHHIKMIWMICLKNLPKKQKPGKLIHDEKKKSHPGYILKSDWGEYK